jgi:hypothetical protein
LVRADVLRWSTVILFFVFASFESITSYPFDVLLFSVVFFPVARFPCSKWDNSDNTKCRRKSLRASSFFVCFLLCRACSSLIHSLSSSDKMLPFVTSPSTFFKTENLFLY